MQLIGVWKEHLLFGLTKSDQKPQWLEQSK